MGLIEILQKLLTAIVSYPHCWHVAVDRKLEIPITSLRIHTKWFPMQLMVLVCNSNSNWPKSCEKIQAEIEISLIQVVNVQSFETDCGTHMAHPIDDLIWSSGP